MPLDDTSVSVQSGTRWAARRDGYAKTEAGTAHRRADKTLLLPGWAMESKSCPDCKGGGISLCDHQQNLRQFETNRHLFAGKSGHPPRYEFKQFSTDLPG